MLKKLIEAGEGITLEFKSTIDSAQRIARTLAAFANTRGGVLLIGVEDDGQISGILSEAEEMSKIEQAAGSVCSPPIDVLYESQYEEEMHVLLIRIEESNQKPHFVRHISGERQVYIRVHDKSIPAGSTMEKQLHREPVTASKALLQSPNVKMLLKYLETNDFITVKRYAKLINVSERRAGKLLTDLAEAHLLTILEQDRGIVYALK